MQTLELLAVGLGLAGLAGINLYLTVFVTGLAVRFDWLQLSEAYARLEVLGDPIVIGISGFLFFVEFFADKVPWVDSLWDSVHTVIRPVGGAMLAILALGEPNPAFEVVAVLLAGGLALTTHAAKAGIRLVVNGSPEPFSNVALSLAEDGLVLGGLATIAWNPFVALGILAAAVVAIGIAAPRMWRAGAARMWFVWRKLSVPADEKSAAAAEVPLELECAVHQNNAGNANIPWAVPAVSGRVPGFVKNLRGWLVVVESDTPSVCFAARRRGEYHLHRLSDHLGSAEYRHGFLYDRLACGGAEVLVDRGRRASVERKIRCNAVKARPSLSNNNEKVRK